MFIHPEMKEATRERMEYEMSYQRNLTPTQVLESIRKRAQQDQGSLLAKKGELIAERKFLCACVFPGVGSCGHKPEMVFKRVSKSLIAEDRYFYTGGFSPAEDF